MFSAVLIARRCLSPLLYFVKLFFLFKAQKCVSTTFVVVDVVVDDVVDVVVVMPPSNV